MTTGMERALAHRRVRKSRRELTADDLDVALAWLDGALTYGQVHAAFLVSSSVVYQRLAIAARQAVASGRLMIVKAPEQETR